MIDFMLRFGLPLLGVVVGGIALELLRILKNQRHSRQRDVRNTGLVMFDIRREHDDGYRKAFLDRYFETLIDYAKKARHRIVVLDYLAHHRALNTMNDSVFPARYSEYFEALEEAVAGRGVSYQRFLQLPLGANPSQSRDVSLRQAVDLMFYETSAHIYRMMHKDSRFELFCLAAAIRPYSFLIVDDRHILTEYDRYTKAGISVPDHIFVNSVEEPRGGAILDFIEVHKNHLASARRRHGKGVTQDEFAAALAELDNEPSYEEVRVALSMPQAEFERLTRERGVRMLEWRALSPVEMDKIQKNHQKKRNLLVA